MTLPPSGWYADPVDPAGLRWWDGTQWTQATTRASVAGPEESEPVGGGSDEQGTDHDVGGHDDRGHDETCQNVRGHHEPGAVGAGDDGTDRPAATGPGPEAAQIGAPWMLPDRSADQGEGAPGPGEQGYGDQAYGDESHGSTGVPAFGAAGYGAAGYAGGPGAPGYGGGPRHGEPGGPVAAYPEPFPGYRGAPPAGVAPGAVGPGGKALTTPDGQPLAGLGARFVGRILDALLAVTLGLLAGFPLWVQAWRRLVDYLDSIGALDPNNPQPIRDPLALYTDSGIIGPIIGGVLVMTIVRAVYTIGLVGWKGATLGKMAVGVRIRSWDRPGVPTYWQATQRWLTGEFLAFVTGLVATGIYVLLDYLWPVWDSRKQALHDKWPKTVVVKK